jgi:signal transduction histidine kinase
LGTDPSSDVLQRRAFPELAEALRGQVGQIVNEWKQLVREVIPETTSGLSAEELEDGLPEILGSIADALASDAPEGTRRLMERSPSQGITRFQQHYDVRELAMEDRLLRRVVVERVAAALGRRATVEEEIALHMGLDIMLQQAVVAFVTHQGRQLRAAAEAELQYLSFLSHDLGGNLGNVTLWLQVLKLELAGSPQFAGAAEALDAAQQAILDTMGGMGRLLQAERLRHRGEEQKVGPVNLHEVSSGVAVLFAQQAEKKGVKLAVDVPPDATETTDAELVRLVLQNLIGNAVKYSGRGAVRVGAARVGDGRAAHWVLSVSDEGVGIAPEHLGHIFDAFRRGQTHGQQGLGLGLTIASRAAALLNAELTVQSAVGVGSTFRLAFPPEGGGRAIGSAQTKTRAT